MQRQLWELMEGCGCSYRGILTTSDMFSGASTEPEWLKITSCSYLLRHVSLIGHKLCSFYIFSSYLTHLLIGALQSVKTTFSKISYLF